MRRAATIIIAVLACAAACSRRPPPDTSSQQTSDQPNDVVATPLLSESSRDTATLGDDDWGRDDLVLRVMPDLGIEWFLPASASVKEEGVVRGVRRLRIVAEKPHVDVLLAFWTDTGVSTQVLRQTANEDAKVPEQSWSIAAEGSLNGWRWVEQDRASRGDSILWRRYGRGQAGSYALVICGTRHEIEQQAAAVRWLNLMRLTDRRLADASVSEER